MKNRFFIIVKQFLFTWLILSSSAFLYGQTPSIAPKKLEFEKICAGNYNQFRAAFTIANFPAGTTFVVELSDNLGSFSNPVSTTTLPHNTFLDTPPDTPTDKTLTFAVPTTLIGSEIYKLRVKSSTGVVVVSGAFPNNKFLTSFPAYYKPFEGSFFINNQAATVNICSGGNTNLSIDNPTPSTQNSSPVNYPNLKYKWYKDGTPITGQTGTSLNVNAAGTYYVEIDYGGCFDVESHSQNVVVNIASNGSVAISSSLGNPFCSSAGSTTLSADAGNSYQWYKDNVAISGANGRTYVTNQSGNYSVAVNFGSCVANGTIDLKNYDFTSSINVPNVNSIAEGEILNVIATTTASNPDYKWYLNGSVIPGATGSTYDVSSSGSYKVVITQTTGCISSNEIPFVVRSGNVSQIPNIISLGSSYPFNVWDIPNEYKNPKTRVQIISSIGVTALDTYDYQSDWPASGASDFKNINPVYYYVITSDNAVKKGSITIIK